MATNDTELIAESRSLTDYDTSVISDSDYQDLVDVAKEELKADTNNTSLTFYGSDTFSEDRALYWLVNLFAKIHAGEIEAPTYSLADLEEAPLDGQNNLWWDMYHRRRGAISDARGFALGSISRTDREYSFE